MIKPVLSEWKQILTLFFPPLVRFAISRYFSFLGPAVASADGWMPCDSCQTSLTHTCCSTQEQDNISGSTHRSLPEGFFCFVFKPYTFSLPIYNKYPVMLIAGQRLPYTGQLCSKLPAIASLVCNNNTAVLSTLNYLGVTPLDILTLHLLTIKRNS